MSELFANPLGCLSLALRSKSAAELMAPQQTATMSPSKVVFFPDRPTPLPLTSMAVPAAFVKQPSDLGLGHQRHVWQVHDFADAVYVRIRFGMHQAG